GDQLGRGRKRLDAGPRDRAVVGVAGRQDEDERAALGVADGVELGVAAAFGAADTMSQAPPFAPPAQRWALMQLESMNNRSAASSAPARALKILSQTPRSAQRTKRL